MNRYVERVQSVLQSGTPDNDILVYWPVFDVWDSPDGMTQQLGVHDVKWLTDTSAGRLARSLMARGLRLRLHLGRAARANEDGRGAAGDARRPLQDPPSCRRPGACRSATLDQ